MEAMGYDAVILYYTGHMAVGIDVEEPYESSHVSMDGTDYYYCETTYPGWLIGEKPPKWSNAILTVQVS